MPRRLQQPGLDAGYVKMCCTSIYGDLERVCASCKSLRLCAWSPHKTNDRGAICGHPVDRRCPSEPFQGVATAGTVRIPIPPMI